MAAVRLKVFTGVLAFVMAISCVVVLNTMLSFQWTIKPAQPGNVESRSAPAENSADLRGHVFVIEYRDQLSQAVKNFFQISHILRLDGTSRLWSHSLKVEFQVW